MADLTERVARALYEREAKSLGFEPVWVFRSPGAFDYKRQAAAALAAVADTPGLEEALAQVLLDHQPGPGYPWDRSAPITLTAAECWCGWETPREHFGWRRREWHRKHQADVLADVVRAWLRGEPRG